MLMSYLRKYIFSNIQVNTHQTSCCCAFQAIILRVLGVLTIQQMLHRVGEERKQLQSHLDNLIHFAMVEKVCGERVLHNSINVRFPPSRLTPPISFYSAPPPHSPGIISCQHSTPRPCGLAPFLDQTANHIVFMFT